MSNDRVISKATKSPVDEAFLRFRQLSLGHFPPQDVFEKFTESDTRSKFIDPLFQVVLEWHENDIRREKSAADGFSDYVIGAEYAYFHIEAKRLRPQFKLNCLDRSRILKLEGPHLLKQKTMRPHLEQTAKYSADLGTDFALLTNGIQIIIFPTRQPGRSWKTGHAIVFHDWKDIEDNFADFYNLLSKDNVRKGSLNEAFAEVDTSQIIVHPPIEEILNSDTELIRNPFWSKISHIVSPYLDVDPSDVKIQSEIIDHCYVKSPLSDQMDQGINKLLTKEIPQFLKDANVKNLKLENLENNYFTASIETDIKTKKIGTYLLTGGVGSGKTTFLRRFAQKTGKRLIEHYCLWLHIDYLPAGNIDPNFIDIEIRNYTYEKIYSLLKDEYPSLWPKDGETIRKVFEPQIREIELTKLHGVPRGTARWEEEINLLITSLYNNKPLFTQALIQHVSRRGLRVVFVLDNTDQLGESVQESVFLLAQKLSQDYSAMTILALREEKFFAAFRRGLFDAYGDKRFHIGSPALQHVLEKRLSFIKEKIKNAAKGDPLSFDGDLDNILSLIDVFTKSTMITNQNIVRYLSCVSNGDMRLALSTFKTFISSGNLDTSKILRIYKEEGKYTVPFHEFAKSAILGSRKYFKNNTSHILNLFNRSSARNSSYFTAIRILSRLSRDASAPSSYGEGYIPTGQILQEFRQCFGTAEDLVARGSELLLRGLIESEPPRSPSLEKTDALHISAAGEYYWKYLVRSFAYLDLVYLDTPITDREVSKQLVKLTEGGNKFDHRFQRVNLFLNYLLQAETTEQRKIQKSDSPFSLTVMQEIIEQIQQEILYIKGKI